MKRVQKKIGILIGILIITYIMLSGKTVFAEEDKNEKWNVLFISSYNSNFISFEDQVEGIKAGFKNNVNLFYFFPIILISNKIKKKELILWIWQQ